MIGNTVEEFSEIVRKELNRLHLAPEGAEVAQVTVLIGNNRKDARKKRANAALDKNLGVDDSLFITFQPASPAASSAHPTVPKSPQPAPAPPTQVAASATPASGPDTLDSELEGIIKALAQAEQIPGHSFVALKWFRDVYLPGQQAWAAAVDTRNGALREAIDRGLILVSRLPNPKNPQFPTSALRVNRANAAAQRILGPGPGRWGFTPIKIEGEPLSETVRRMRDERY